MSVLLSDSDERVNTKFHVRDVNLNIQKNTKEHHTDGYMCTKREKNQELVVRRGQPFIMTITFDRPYRNEENEIFFHFKTGIYSTGVLKESRKIFKGSSNS